MLLVTLLLANAACMEALPLFLEHLMPDYLAIIVSVTAVLFFGEYAKEEGYKDLIFQNDSICLC